jgi:2-polyprenyl-6-methoxyphenol hydroxylase-like FAD-dependent oxidoreductase
MKILIVGGGLGGMMLAAFLEKFRLDYQLIEQSPENAAQGFSLGVWCNTRNLFTALGLQKEFDSIGTPIHSYDILTSKGRPLRKLNFTDFYHRYGMAYTQANRHELRALLQSQTDPNRLHFQTILHSIAPQGDRTAITLSNGQTKTCDLVVGADGVYSTVRHAAFGPSLHTHTGWRAWYVWIDQSFCPRNGMVEYLGPGRCVGLFADGPQTLAIFFAACDPAAPDHPDQRVSTLKTLFPDELKNMPGALDEIPPRQIMTTNLAIVRLPKFTRNRIVLIGDAAHAFEPHTGLGASMAMEDAFVLATQLQHISVSLPLSTALMNFHNARKNRLTIALRLNNKIRTFAFIKSPAIRSIANAVIPFVPEQVFTKHYRELFNEHCGKAERNSPTSRQFVAGS